MTEPEKVHHNVEYLVSPEFFRILTYVSFMFVIFVGWYLTTHHSHIDFKHNPMVDAFGYNNVCVLFDFPPATYVLPMLYPFTLLFWTIYLYTHWLRARFLIQSRPKFAIFTFVSVVQILCATAFSIIFAVNPNENLTVHYAGFTALIFALMLLALTNFIYFKAMMLDNALVRFFGVVYLISALIIGTIKLFFAFNFLVLGKPWLHPFGYQLLPDPEMITIYLIIDRLWLLIFLVIPFLYSFYLYKKLPHLDVKFTMRRDKDDYPTRQLKS